MQAANRNNHQHLGINGVHLGVSAGPLSLLLLPKCPLCLMPLLAVLGLAMPRASPCHGSAHIGKCALAKP